MQALNFQTTNPAQLVDRVTELQVAVQLDEQNNLAVAEYATQGAIALGGVALLKTGTAGAFTLTQPIPGSQLSNGQDGLRMRIVSLDAEAYTVTTAADGINGTGDTLTASAAVGDTVDLLAFNGVWYIEKTTTGTPAWALTEA